MVDLNFNRTDTKELLNKKRIHSKRLLNHLDVLECELLKKNLINFNFTILSAYFKDKKVSLTEAWNTTLKDIIKKINDTFNDRYVNTVFLNYGIEMHRDGVNIDNTDKFKALKKKNKLRDYPHVHGFVSLAISQPEDRDQERINIQGVLINEFIDYDVKFTTVSTQRHGIKNALKYILKEYKLEDIHFFLNKFGYSLKDRIVYKVFSVEYKTGLFSHSLRSMVESIEKLNLISSIQLINSEVVVFDNVSDPIYRLNLLVKNELYKKQHTMFKNNIYYMMGDLENKKFNRGGLLKSNYKNCNVTWGKHSSFKSYLYTLAIDNPKNANFILSNIKKYLIMYNESTDSNFIYIDDLFHHNLMEIEYADFILDLNNECNKHIVYKDDSFYNYEYREYCCFKYFDFYSHELLSLEHGVQILRGIFDSDEDFMVYLKRMGYILGNFDSEKGQSMYMFGPSGTGKSLITEKLLTELYGEDEVAVLNYSDKRFLLSQANNKKILMINEFKHTAGLRETLLKILDGTYVEVNEKYKSSKKTSIKSHSIAISNYSMSNQKMDRALKKRFVEVKTSNTINREEYQLILESLPLLLIYCVYSLKFIKFKDLNLFIYNLLDKNNITTEGLLKTPNNKALNNTLCIPKP